MVKRITGLLLALSLCTVCLAACALLPKEEEQHVIPVVRSHEQEEFTLVTVQRGDLALTESVTCTYIPVRTETLSFAAGDLPYDESFVEAGDIVTQGQLLMQLDMENIEEELAAREKALKEIELKLSYIEENRALAVKRTQVQYQNSSWSERQKALDHVNEQYDIEQHLLEDEQYVTQLEKQEFEQKRDERQIRAPFDGTVTFVYQVMPWQLSIAGSPMLALADSAMSLFRGETAHWDLFEPGQEVTITVQDVDYEAIVASEEEAGQPAQEKTEGKRAYVYFMLKTPDITLQGGIRGTITLTLETRTDVLLLPSHAVTKAGEQHIVYYLDEEGLKDYKPVEIGLEANKMVEILSGVTEGESVIYN